LSNTQFLLSFFCIAGLMTVSAQQYAPASSPRISYNFNPDWEFTRADVTNGQAEALDDSKWKPVSAPHNDCVGITVYQRL
jgi:hypothetical protein